MHEYDTTLKTLLTRPGCGLLASLTGCSGEEWRQVVWHNVELPEVRNLRVDLLGEVVPEGRLIHVELQRSNDSAMLLRMAEYAISIRRQFGRWPSQFVLYIGEEALRMPARIETDALSFSCAMVDIREFDAEPLLSSRHLEDNIVAILGRLQNEREALKRILARIAVSGPARRARALNQLTILAGLRKLESTLGQEAHKMPILDDIMDHDLFGPAIRQGLEQGRHEGLEEGLESERRLILRLIDRRFGPVPAWASARIQSSAFPELEEIGLKLLDAPTLEVLFSSLK